jgi:conjugal transfer pilus assembly protein TraD
VRPDPLPPRPRRAPLWTLPALLVLLILPGGVGPALLAASAIGSLAVSVVRARRARRSADAVAQQRGSVVLGRALQGGQVILAENQLAAHGLILGASGAGKTTSLLRILTERIRAGEPVVAIDMKASPEFERTLRAACAAAGRPLRVWRPAGPEQWNPLAYGNPTELKDKLIGSERFTEPHYKRQAERYLQLALGVLMDRHPGRAPELAEAIDALEPRRLSRLSADLEPHRAHQIGEYVATLGPDGTSAVRGLATRLALLAESHAGPFLRGEAAGTGPPSGQVDLRRALDGEEVMLFSLPSSTLGSLAAQLGTLAVQDLISASGHRLDAGPQRVATVGIDEFSALGNDHLEHLLARGRESGVSVMLATQEYADLERAGRGFADQVVGVTALKVIHRQDVPASALRAAQMAGSVEVWDETHRFGGTARGRWGQDGGTRRLVERHRVHPDTIASLRTGEALVITKIPAAEVRLVNVEPPTRLPPAAAPAPAPRSLPAATRELAPPPAAVSSVRRRQAVSPPRPRQRRPPPERNGPVR